MKYCPHCGASIEKRSTQCINCGVSLCPEGKSEKRDRFWTTLLVVIVVIIIIGYAAMVNGTTGSQVGLTWKVESLRALTNESQEPLNSYGRAPISNLVIESARVNGFTFYLLDFRVMNLGTKDIKEVPDKCSIALKTTDDLYGPYAEDSGDMAGIGMPSIVEESDTIYFHSFFKVPSEEALICAQLTDSSGSDLQYIDLALPKM